MKLRYAAALPCVAQGVIWLAIQPGFRLMGDITGEDDGDVLQGLALLIPAVLLAIAFVRSRASWFFLAWNAVWLVLWAIYSSFHLGRWASEGAGQWWLLVPELFVGLHALALLSGVAALLPPSGRRQTPSP